MAKTGSAEVCECGLHSGLRRRGDDHSGTVEATHPKETTFMEAPDTTKRSKKSILLPVNNFETLIDNLEADNEHEI